MKLLNSKHPLSQRVHTEIVQNTLSRNKYILTVNFLNN